MDQKTLKDSLCKSRPQFALFEGIRLNPRDGNADGGCFLALHSTFPGHTMLVSMIKFLAILALSGDACAMSMMPRQHGNSAGADVLLRGTGAGHDLVSSGCARQEQVQPHGRDEHKPVISWRQRWRVARRVVWTTDAEAIVIS